VFGQPRAADRFWAHGYNDVLDGMFVTAALPGNRSRTRVAGNAGSPSSASWQGLCGSQASNPAEQFAEQIRNTAQPKPEQLKEFDDLQAALGRAFERIQATCPEAPAVNATDRMDLMSARLLAFRQAMTMVQTPLRAFYAVLDDEQKSRLNGADPVQPVSTGAATSPPPGGAMGCAEAADAEWPTAKLMRRVGIQREQMKDAEVLRGTSDAFARFVATTCAVDKVQTAPERLEAAQKRLNVMRYAVRHVSPALDQFYGSLAPAQKLRFSSLGR
jgi:hypothetical protein